MEKKLVYNIGLCRGLQGLSYTAPKKCPQKTVSSAVRGTSQTRTLTWRLESGCLDSSTGFSQNAVFEVPGSLKDYGEPFQGLGFRG